MGGWEGCVPVCVMCLYNYWMCNEIGVVFALMFFSLSLSFSPSLSLFLPPSVPPSLPPSLPFSQPCHVVYTEYRPVPLQHYVYPSGADGLYLVVDEKVHVIVYTCTCRDGGLDLKFLLHEHYGAQERKRKRKYVCIHVHVYKNLQNKLKK